MSEIEVRRRRGWVGVFVSWRVYVDEREVGRLWPGRSVRTPVPAGEHTIRARGVGCEVSNVLTVTVTLGSAHVRTECGFNNSFAIDQIVDTATMTPAGQAHRLTASLGADPIETLILREVPARPSRPWRVQK